MWSMVVINTSKSICLKGQGRQDNPAIESEAKRKQKHTLWLIYCEHFKRPQFLSLVPVLYF